MCQGSVVSEKAGRGRQLFDAGKQTASLPALLKVTAGMAVGLEGLMLLWLMITHVAVPENLQTE